MQDCCPFAACLKSRGFILAASFGVLLAALVAGVLAQAQREGTAHPGSYPGAALVGEAPCSDVESAPCQRFHAGEGKEPSRQLGSPLSGTPSACPTAGALEKSCSPPAATDPSRVP